METRVRYVDIRPCMVPDSLDELAGPTRGVIVLPTGLDWSQQRRYDLGVDKDRRRLYETVIREAVGLHDLCSLLETRLLVRLWPMLWLPPQVRRLWEDRFPELRHMAPA
jgi:hypothetical protein